MTRRYLAGPIVATLAVGSLAVGVALANGSDSNTDDVSTNVARKVVDQEVHPAAAAVVASFSAFAQPSSESSATPAQQAALRNALGAGPDADYGAIGNADFSMAKAVPVQGSSQPAWLVPSGGQVCIVLKDPVDGFGATCQTLSAIKAGRGVLTLTPQKGSADTTALVAVIVPDGGEAPLLETAEGATRLAARDNVAASVASTSDKIRTAAGSLSLRSE
jgi:hypothetical protein